MKFDKWINDSEKYEFCKSYGGSQYSINGI